MSSVRYAAGGVGGASDFSASGFETHTGLGHEIGAFYGGEDRPSPRTRILLTAVIAVCVLGLGLGLGLTEGSSGATGFEHAYRQQHADNGGGAIFKRCMLFHLEGWAILFPRETNDNSLLIDSVGENSGIPAMVFQAAANAEVAETENGIQAGQLSLASATVANCKTLIGEGDDPSSWPTAPSS